MCVYMCVFSWNQENICRQTILICCPNVSSRATRSFTEFCLRVRGAWPKRRSGHVGFSGFMGHYVGLIVVIRFSIVIGFLTTYFNFHRINSILFHKNPLIILNRFSCNRIFHCQPSTLGYPHDYEKNEKKKHISPIRSMWGPQTIAKWVNITPITMVYYGLWCANTSSSWGL